MENSAILDFIDNVLGEYTLKYDSAGNLIGGLAGLDYRWLFAAFLLGASVIGCICLGRTVIRYLFD